MASSPSPLTVRERKGRLAQFLANVATSALPVEKGGPLVGVSLAERRNAFEATERPAETSLCLWRLPVDAGQSGAAQG